MGVEVSVIMAAHQAADTIARAAVSVFAQDGVDVELVVCADDDLDYGALLAMEKLDADRLTLCRTPSPRSGPPAARNMALRHARGEIIACLDADDEYAPGRLALLLPLVARCGVATGPTREIPAGGRNVRIACPRGSGSDLSAADICELRMPFSPVYRKTLWPHGWPQIDFAEDVILNIDLLCAAGTYPFVPGADYIYHVSRTSRTQSESALREARAGYLQILDLARGRHWPADVRSLVQRVFSEDLTAVDAALARGRDGAAWRSAVRHTADE